MTKKPRKPVNRRPTFNPSNPETWGGPTIETKTKLKRDSVRILVEAGRLGPAEESAAQEIEAVFLMIARGMLTKVSAFERRSPGTEAEPAEWLADAWGRRYKPWADRCVMLEKQGGPPLLGVVLDVVTGGWTCNEVDRNRKQREGKAADWLVEGLVLYAKMTERGPRR